MFERMTSAAYRQQLARSAVRTSMANPYEDMNQTEAAYATLLDARKLAGEVLGWFFQPFPLQLAPHTLYHFDFLVCEPTKVCIVEIKGFLRDDASVKFRVAAHMFQAYEFLMLRKKSEAFVKVRGMYFPVPRSAR